MQSWVRDLKPPVEASRTVSLGFAGSALVGIAVVDHLEGEFFHIPVVARALDRRGERVGTAILDHAIDMAAARAFPDSDHIILSGNVEQWLLRVDFEIG